jgi:CubicO group peptidase (beta-lactamase class C family)
MGALDLIRQWPVPHAAAGWVDDAGKDRRSESSDRVFELASVTKPLFALSILIAVEEGTLSLEQPAGPPGSTIRHLLAHASGYGPDQAEAIAPVGTRRIYSNAGFELLGRELEQSSGMSAATYFDEAIVQPLGLAATTLHGSPAHAASSTIDDLLLIVRELLRPTLISPVTLAEAVRPQFGELDGVLPGYGRQSPNPWGLGFEIKGTKSPHWTSVHNHPSTFGHFGRSGTMLWIDPSAGVGAVALTDRDFGPWSIEAWPSFSESVLDDAS